MKKIKRGFLLALCCAVLCACCLLFGTAANTTESDGSKWIGAWSTGPTDVSLKDYGNIAFVGGKLTARVVFTPTASGKKVRLRLTNYYGTTNLTIEKILIADSKSEGANPDNYTSVIDKDTAKYVTYNGKTRITIPKGEEIITDPVNFDVKAMKNIAVSLYLKNPGEVRTMGLSGGTSFLSLQGDDTEKASIGLTESIGVDLVKIIQKVLPKFNVDLNLTYKFIRVVPVVSGIEVLSDKDSYTTVVVGDSTVSNQFPAYLAQNIYEKGIENVGVLGKGIIGNQLQGNEETLASNLYGKSLLKRFDVDVLNQSNVKYAIVKIGANDILHPVCGDAAKTQKQPSANDLINAFKEICNRCHKKGIKVILCTISQWKGTTRDYFGAGASYNRTTAQFNADWKIATDVNAWIKDSANTYHDGYYDVVGLSADPKDPARYNPIYTEDWIHPNDTLQKIWADNFPLGLIGVDKRVAGLKLDASSKVIHMFNNTGDTGFVKLSSVIPANAENKSVNWTSSNDNVVEITSFNQTGANLRATGLGTAYIKCTSRDTGVSATCKIVVKNRASAVKVSGPASVYTKKSITLKAAVGPSDADNKNVTWSTSNKNIATVNSKGVVTGVGAGVATITATSVGSKTVCGRFNVTVKKTIDVTNITLTSKEKSIYKGGSATLTALISPNNATFPAVKWSSSNTKVATVDKNGKIKAVNGGTCTITCKNVENPMAKASCKVKVLVKVSKIKASAPKTSLFMTDSETLKVSVSPSNATNKAVTYKSSNTKIATVSSKGVVKGIKPGKVTITVTSKDNSKAVSKVTITIKNIVKTTSVKLNAQTKKLAVRGTFQLKPTYAPNNASIKKCTYSSSNKKVATVDSKGKVKAVSKGSCTITCKTTDTGKTAKCKITVVTVANKSIKFKSNVSVKVGKTAQLTVVFNPTNTTNRTVKYKSSNTKIATVDKNGKVKGIKPGKVTITATSAAGKTAKCTVTVPTIKVNSIDISKTDIVFKDSKNVTLKVTKIGPTNATNKKVKWSSSNTNVAKVSSTGVVSPVSNGTCIITCKPVDASGDTAAYCSVKVDYPKVLGITLNKANLGLKVGEQFTITYNVYPSTAGNKKVTWESSNPKIAKIDSKGTVTGVSKGNVDIKCRSVDGNYVAICKVTIK